MLNLLLNNVWVAIGFWAVLYVLDYLFTMKAARMHRDGANKHFIFSEGIELNPLFKEDVAQLRRFSFRFLLMLVCVAAVLLAAYYFSFPEVFAVSLGALIWMQVANHCRHLRNLMIFYYARTSTGLSGQMRYEHWLSLRISSLDMFCFAGLFMLVFIFWGSLFILGGALGCFALGLRHFIDSRKSRLSAEKKSEVL